MEEVIVYQAPKTTPKTKRIRRFLGFGLISVSLAIVISIAWPILSQELSYRLKKTKKVEYVLETQDLARHSSGFDQLSQEKDIQFLSPVDHNFSLVIPKIGLNSKVFADTDIANEEEYSQVLSQGVAHALGTSFPGQKGTIYIFGHSANFDFSYSEVNAIFYLLTKLEAGDEVNVFYNGRRFIYQITGKNIVSGQETSFLERFGDEQLVLQTCWPPGTRWQRLVIVAKPTQKTVKEI